MNDFSDSYLAGQRLMLGFDGHETDSELKYLIKESKIGGIILFSRNLPGSPQNPEQIRQLCRSAQEYAASCGLPPLFVSTDQEGGKVARLKAPFTEFQGNPALKSEEDAEAVANIMASELKSVGINMNLAPVVDIAEKNTLMSDRAFGNDPEWVSRMGVKFIETLQAGGVMAVAKHFPGIGRTVVDSHLDLPVFQGTPADMEKLELMPFAAAIQCDVAGIMLSHILYQELDPEYPASLSVRIAGELLRHRMGYDGLVITDDLDMGAIAKHYDLKTCIRQILLADVDIILICSKSPNMEIAFEEIMKNFRDSRELREKGLKSLERITKARQRYLGSFANPVSRKSE